MPAKITHTALPTVIGQAVTIRSNVDNSEKRGVVAYFDAAKNAVRVDRNRSSFWVFAVNSASEYVFIQ